MRKSNDQSLSDVLKEFAEQKKFKNKLTSKKFEALWNELFSSITGEYLGKIYYQSGVLTVYITSSALKKNLLLNKKLLLQQLNSRLDEPLKDLELK